ncbi:MAG: lamin tail domain-containing protein [Verrucomicrobiales bacterium]
MIWIGALFSLGLILVELGNAGVVINEIHFNPGKLTGASQREKQEEEFIELFNYGSTPVALDGWRFSRGVDYTFSDIAIPAGGYLVVAADLATFQQLHPAITNVVGPYSGQLSNSAEDIELEDAGGDRVDIVAYADSGHWATLRTTKLKSYDHWEWVAPDDGEGMSLELLDPMTDNNFAHAWTFSKTPGGTPGEENTVSQPNKAPFIGKVEHNPAIPTSRNSITVTAELSGKVATARVLYRLDGTSSFKASDLTSTDDDTWSGAIPSQRDGSIIEYLIEATSDDDSVRRWPELTVAEGRDPLTSPVPARQALCLVQVDDSFSDVAIISGEQSPAYKIIMPRSEIALLRSIAGRSSNNAVYNNRYSGTFISVDPGGTRVRHLCTMRVRGNGSRSAFPPGIRVTFPADDPWKGVQDINLNSQHTHSQVLGSAIYQVMGFPAARATAVTLTMNGEDWTNSGLPQFGHYTCNEVLNSDYIDAHFPTESIGNLYRGVGQANLNDRGDQVSNYRTYYRKRNNASLDDYSDVIQLCKMLDRENESGLSDAQFLAELEQIVDVDQWMRYFALDTLLCNLEGGFPTGRGDDYAMFRGGDGRFRLVPYDLDSILGRGDPSEDLTKSIFAYGNTPGLRRLFKTPEAVRMYFHHIREFLDTSYRPEVLNRIVDEVLGSWVPESEIEEIKTFIPRRVAAVKSQIDGYTVAGTTLEFAGGFHRTQRPDFLLYGRFDPADVVNVRINGREPTKIDLRAGTWMMRATSTDPLVSPGITPVVIEMLGGDGAVVDQSTLQVWYDTGAMTEVSGALTGDATWDAASGPYLVTGEFSVPDGRTLRVSEGTTIFFAAQSALRIEGTLDVKGSDLRSVRFASPVTADAGTWSGLRFEPGSKGNRIAFAEIDGAANTEAIVTAQGTDLVMENVRVGRGESQILAVAGTALEVRGCKFAGGRGFVRAAGGSALVEDCDFGEVTGDWAVFLDDAMDGVASIQGNRFTGGGTKGVVQLGSRALVMRNLFSRATSGKEAAIAVREPVEVIVAGNGFIGWDTALSAASGAAVQFERNRCRFSDESVVRGESGTIQLVDNLIPSAAAPIVFELPDSAWTAGKRPDWKLLGLTGEKPEVATNLLTVTGLPPLGKAAPGQRAVTFRYPGAASFRHIQDGVLQIAQDSTAVFTSDGGSPIDLEVTLLSGSKLTFPDAARWEVLPGHIDVMINEVVAVDEDAIELYNYGLEDVELGGFRLTDDREKPDKFVFPKSAIIRPGQYLVVELGRKNPTTGALAADFRLSADGEEILLIKPDQGSSEAPVDSVQFGPQIAGHSIGRIEGNWQLCNPTLGVANTPTATADARSVRLSEWLAAAGGGGADDFVELRNLASVPADISGCGLTDNIPSAPFRHRFPPLSFLPGNDVQAFFAKGKKAKGGGLEFKLSDDGEVLGFLGADGLTIDWAVFQPQAIGHSQGRDASGNLVTFAVATPGKTAEPDDMDETLVLASVLRISEIHYNPEGDADAEFLELANTGVRPLDLAGVRIAGGIDFLFQEGSRLEPGKPIVVVRSRKAFAKSYGDDVVAVGEYSGKLSNGGDKLRIESPAGIVIQQLEFSDKWHPSTDGGGRSLEAVDLSSTTGDWSRKKRWNPSATDGGTPGR